MLSECNEMMVQQHPTHIGSKEASAVKTEKNSSGLCETSKSLRICVDMARTWPSAWARRGNEVKITSSPAVLTAELHVRG